MSVRYVVRVTRWKKTVTATVVRLERSLPWPRRTTVGSVEWTTETKDPGVLRAEAHKRAMPHIRADQRRRGVLPPFPTPLPPLPARPDGTGRPDRRPGRTGP